jgi:hypothetical protein
MSTEDRNPAALRAEADALEARARDLRREAAALERHAKGRRLCEGKTKSGRPCRNEAVPGHAFCAHHGGPGPRPRWLRPPHPREIR